MSELKNCPFCGGYVKWDWAFADICCGTSGCFLENGADWRVDQDDTEAVMEHEERWNRRAGK